MRKADAVVTITGTMGWEALLYERPVIAFGEAFYSELPTVFRAMDVPKDGWYDLFGRAMQSARPSPDVMERFVSAIQQTSHRGRLHGPRTFPGVLERENVDNLADALIEAVCETTAPSSAVHKQAS